MKSFIDADKKTIGKEVKDQFTLLISAINQSNAEVWQEFYSQDQFLSAIVNTDHYAARSAWVDTITNYFSMREGQQVEPFDVHVTALTPDLALLTSQEKCEMWPKDRQNVKLKHVFTMLWKKEQEEWKILHSHESWLEE
jgi:ketosteroid isomerase-like protein